MAYKPVNLQANVIGQLGVRFGDHVDELDSHPTMARAQPSELEAMSISPNPVTISELEDDYGPSCQTHAD